MTLKKLKQMYNGYSIELYYTTNRTTNTDALHTDTVHYIDIDDIPDDTEIIDSGIMDKNKYLSTLEANTSTTADELEEGDIVIAIIRKPE